MAEYNFLNVPAIHQAAQRSKINQFNLGRAKTGAEREDVAYDDHQKYQNTVRLYGGLKVVDDLFTAGKNDEAYLAADEISRWLGDQGILDSARFNMQEVTPESTRQGLEQLRTQLELSRPVMDPNDNASNVARTWYNPDTQTMWGITRNGQPFDTGVGAQQYAMRPVETAQGTIMVDPSRQAAGRAPVGAVVPGTDPASMRQVAVQDELATGEAGRGRVQRGGEFVAVPGSEAAIKEEEARQKKLAGAKMKSIQAQTVVEDVSRLNELLAAGRVPLGRSADWWEINPDITQSRDYRNAKSLIESVKGNVGVDSLLRIKASGAGLGQVPQTQLDMLSRLLGELDMGQEPEQFMFTWERMGRVYEAIWENADEEMRALGMPPPIIFSLTSGMTMVESPEMAHQLIEQGALKPGDRFLTPDGQIKRVP